VRLSPQILEAVKSGAVPNRLDRVIASVAPVWGLSRMRARMTMAVGNTWTGARQDLPEMRNFNPLSTSPVEDEDVWNRQTLISRAADLIKNDAVAGGTINELVTSVVGTGLSVHPEPLRKVLGWDEDYAAEWAQEVKERFDLWASSPTECDVERRRTFWQAQALAYRAELSRGDAFVLLPRLRHPGSVWNLKLQVLEGDRVLTPPGMRDTEALTQGVACDAYGAPTGYWVSKRYPGTLRGITKDDFGSVPTPAFDAQGRPNVLHLYHELRPGQRRGLPLLAPVIAVLKQLSRLSEAELAAAVVTSFFAVAITKNGSGPGPLGVPTKDSSGQGFAELGPAIVADLNPGETITNVAPVRPNGAFDPFWRSLVGQISLRTQIPPEVLLKKFESSYTAARGALLQFGKVITVERDSHLTTRLCQPVYELWLAEDIAAGRTVAPGFFKDPFLRAALCSARWIGDALPILDPLKEVLAAQERINYTLSTRSEQTTMLGGGDFDVNVEKAARERKKLKESGLIPEPAPASVPIDPNPTLPDGSKQDDTNARRIGLLKLAMEAS